MVAAEKTRATHALRPYLPATRDFASGKDSQRAFLDRCLAAIAQHEAEIGAFVHLNIEGARAASDGATERWRKGEALSPIDGMPIGIKDIMETEDMPTELGSPLFTGWRSGRDAAAVRALREAGAVILGKTVTTEFAATEPRGTRNPHDLGRTPGGSSSGSAAAVAAGFLPAALGTQVVGSLLRPASYCGCFGFKPSFGGINRGGSHDGLSQSCTGVIAASLAECWVVAREIVLRIGGDPGHPGIVGPADAVRPTPPQRLAILRTAGWGKASDAAKAAFAAALARLAKRGVAIVDSHADLAAAEAAIADAQSLTKQIDGWEARWPLNVYRDRDATKLSKHMLDRLAAAEALGVEKYRALIAQRAEARRIFAKLAAIADAVVTLSATGAAPIGLDSTGDAIFNVPASFLGVPALSLPVLAESGLPLGLQMIGFAQQDAALFGAAAWVASELSA
jgi:Asp-tRNA(Asn)/Glu-tRNA(Gln) amidotransferase A subunit family amidase